MEAQLNLKSLQMTIDDTFDLITGHRNFSPDAMPKLVSMCFPTRNQWHQSCRIGKID